MWNSKYNEKIRSGDLILHCVQVRVFQKCEEGMEFSGHGTIKINSVGTIYLEFICTEEKRSPNVFFSERFPKDPLDANQKLFLEVETVEGDIFKASGFSMNLSMSIRQPPSVQHIFLPSIVSAYQVEDKLISNKDEKYLCFEFMEHFNIPANVSNETKSTLEGESHKFNQIDIHMDGYLVTMIKHDKYTQVRVKGVFDVETIKNCLKFYIGFSCGSMPQLGYIIERTGLTVFETLSSVSNSQKLQLSKTPMVSNLSTNTCMSGSYHYDLFKCIVELYQTYPKRFESIVAQWERVWFAGQSNDVILTLTLSVAIEGVLNDVYIPHIKAVRDSDEADKEKAFIKQQLKKTELSVQQRERIINSVSHWNNVTSSHALSYLIKKGLLVKGDKKNWTELRNSCAHPKVIDKTIDEEREEASSVFACLNLFYRLILNTLSYSGWINLHEPQQEVKVVPFKHCKILG
ncbi:hypothetical protein NDL37_002590 [Vibrio parahaemolyticus]|nr:hypothetical protein [Vibrio parahaemolyticus]